MTKDLQTINNIDKRLRTPRADEQNVFPLSPTHRKELRQLRDRNIGCLKLRLRQIKVIKSEEFYNKYKSKAEKELKQVHVDIIELNKKFETAIKHLKLHLDDIKKYQEESQMQYIDVDHDYNNYVCQLKTDNLRRKYSFSQTAVKSKLDEMFKLKFDNKFSEVQQQIDKALEQYEEAINFGDLEMVKELYYSLKDADKFLNGVSNIKV